VYHRNTFMISLFLIVVVVVVVVIAYLLLAYNGLIRLSTQVKEAWSDIEVQLKRRYNLIPNLVETVKGYMQHERGTFESVTKARAEALNAQTPVEHAAAQNALTGTLKTLFAVAENYPELKANTNFLELQRELSDTENKIQAAHRFYNTTVRDFNIKVQSVPTNIIANLFGFKSAEFFELDDPAAKQVPKVSF
jgi:LemA protein